MPDGEELSGVGRTSGARNEATRALMAESIKSGKCPFCSPRFEELNGERIVSLEHMPKHWNVFRNSGPLSGTKLHIMLAPKRHCASSVELESDELTEKQEIIEELQDLFGYASSTQIWREGDMRFNSATVEHMHGHVIVSSGEPADASRIPARHLHLIEELMPLVEEMARESGQKPLEVLDALRGHIDVYREWKLGKAVPIRVKLSNKVGNNVLDQSN